MQKGEKILYNGRIYECGDYQSEGCSEDRDLTCWYDCKDLLTGEIVKFDAHSPETKHYEITQCKTNFNRAIGFFEEERDNLNEKLFLLEQKIMKIEDMELTFDSIVLTHEEYMLEKRLYEEKLNSMINKENK